MSTQPAATARRTLRALWWGWKAEFSGAAEYRADLISGALVSTIWLVLSAAPALVVSEHAHSVGGWTLPRLLFLQAIWYLLDAMMFMFMHANCLRWSDAARLGTFDAVLLRPVNSLVLCSLGSIYVQDVPKVILGIGLGTGAVIAANGMITVGTVLAALVATACGLCLFWAAGVLANYKALSQVQFDGLFAVQSVQNLARVPTPMYGTVLHAVLTVAVPVSFLTTVPAQLMFGELDLRWLGAAIAVATAAVALTSALWRRELRRYTGAMG